jgi:hypothetical protein
MQEQLPRHEEHEDFSRSLALPFDKTQVKRGDCRTGRAYVSRIRKILMIYDSALLACIAR